LTTNLTTAGLLTVIRLSSQKGINLIAYGLVAATLLCIGIESILSFYLHHHFRLWWSLIKCLRTACYGRVTADALPL
jgi:hypothetical protein